MPTSLHLDIDVVPSNNPLFANGNDLNLDIDYAKAFSADIDLYKARVNGFVKLAKACDQPDRTSTNGSKRRDETLGYEKDTLLDIMEWVGARATRHCTKTPNGGSQSMDECTV